MPDLPLDTLFIVGLLVASFVGKIIEAKAKKNQTGHIESIKASKSRQKKHFTSTGQEGVG